MWKEAKKAQRRRKREGCHRLFCRYLIWQMSTRKTVLTETCTFSIGLDYDCIVAFTIYGSASVLENCTNLLNRASYIDTSTKITFAHLGRSKKHGKKIETYILYFLTFDPCQAKMSLWFFTSDLLNLETYSSKTASAVDLKIDLKKIFFSFLLLLLLIIIYHCSLVI